MVMAIIGDVLRGIIAGGLVLAGVLIISIWVRDRTRKLSYLRMFVQISSASLIFVTFLTLALWPSFVFGAIIFATIFFGRAFCGWVCPFGLYMDLINLIRKSIKIGYRNLSERVNKYLHKLKYVIVAFILLLPFLVGALDPHVWSSFLLFQGPFKDLVIVFLGPLEPLIIPWPGAIGFDGYSFSYPYIRGIMDYSNGIFVSINTLFFIGFTVASSFIVRRFWCRFCPTAVSIAAVDKFRRSKWIPLFHIYKEEEKCTKCGICKRVCPLQVTEVYEEKGGEITTSMCMLCLRCVEMCPYEDCLKVNFAGKTVFKSRNWLEPSKIE